MFIHIQRNEKYKIQLTKIIFFEIIKYDYILENSRKIKDK